MIEINNPDKLCGNISKYKLQTYIYRTVFISLWMVVIIYFVLECALRVKSKDYIYLFLIPLTIGLIFSSYFLIKYFTKKEYIVFSENELISINDNYQSKIQYSEVISLTYINGRDQFYKMELNNNVIIKFKDEIKKNEVFSSNKIIKLLLYKAPQALIIEKRNFDKYKHFILRDEIKTVEI